MKLAALLLLCATSASAGYVNIDKGVVVEVAKCELYETLYDCLVVSLEEKLYLLVVDQKGKKLEYSIDDNGSLHLIWNRDSI